MDHYKYERLSAQDNDFLQWERDNLPMHAGAIQIFDAGDLATDGGGIDFATITHGIESILHKIPRYRQKLAWIPGKQHAVWIDDPHFNLAYHVRHTALPRPGSDEQLKRLAARVSERPLDRSRPLWEIWVVEGLAGGRFATIGKTHHCMIDGVGGIQIAQTLFSATPEYTIPEPQRYIPRQAPSSYEIRRDEWLRVAELPMQTVRGLRNFIRSTENVPREIRDRARAIVEMASLKVVPTSDTPLNGPVGPHRVLDWLVLSLADIKAVRHKLECSVNDVVLAIVTGAVRDFLIERQVQPNALEFRVASPVNVRSQEEHGTVGNRVSSWIVPLPIREPDPLRQVARIRATTRKLKKSHQAAVVEMVETLHEWIPMDIQLLSTGTQNMYVTNVPGPQFPLYLLGAQLLEVFVQAPLIENLGLNVGALSYNGKLCWGLTADYDRVPDVSQFAALIRSSFERLAEAAEVRTQNATPIVVHGAASGEGR
jgi:diacylglycerol O-acyltransferase